jgi:hypothetical protein
MPPDARPAVREIANDPSASARARDTLQVAANAYELHTLPPKETTAPVEANPHDESDGCDSFAASSLHSGRQNMSRAPLLVRSSPAQGTGSYGGLPILSMSSSPDESDDHHVTNFQQRSKRKGKSRLRHSEPAHRPLSRDQSHDDSIRSEPVSVASRSRRRSARLDDALAGQAEFGPESRFNGGLAPSAIGATSLLGSSNSSHLDEEEESSESEDYDVKDHGHPPDNSPFALVRASVAATDDLSLSINTPRMWTLSILFAVLGSSTNLFFSLRYPSVSISPIIALLLVHPLGLLWDQLLKRYDDPGETFLDGVRQPDSGSVYANGSRPTSRHSSHLSQPKPSRSSRFRLWLAQGRWNAKEHCCVYISSNVSFGFAFATDVSTMRHRSITLTYAGHCRTNEVLPPRSWYRLSDLTHPLHPDPWLCTRWAHSSVSRSPQRNDLAQRSCAHNHVHCVTQGGEQAGRRLDHLTSKVLRARLRWLCGILLPTRPPYARLELFQCHHLVCAQECCSSQPCRSRYAQLSENS